MKELTLDEKKKIILDEMIDVDRFCRENDIRYVISSGTLLGAVRHGGFIPWDDDADMLMPREDFNRFIEIYKSRKYHLVYDTKNDSESFVNVYAKVTDPTTISKPNRTPYRYGVFLDIFPLDSVPEDPSERIKYIHRAQSAQNRLYHRQKKDIVSILKSYRHSVKWWRNRCLELVSDPRYAESPLCSHILGTMDGRTVINKDRFDSLREIEFEGHKFMAFSDTHSYLSMVYGEDYMTPPPEKDRVGHYETFYRLDP